jgi:3'(2'),5'-bisphosphate nucleotidase
MPRIQSFAGQTIRFRTPMIDIQTIRRIAEDAGQQVMSVYRQAIAAAREDEAPFAAAQRCSHRALAKLGTLTPEIPVLSAQDAETVRQSRNWNRYWLVDPLDGNDAFVKRSGKFTINVALIEDGEPVLGVVHAPALETCYWGARDEGACKTVAGGPPRRLEVAIPPTPGQAWRMVGSPSQTRDELAEFIIRLPDAQLLDSGDSLGLCLVAEGAADLYPCLRATRQCQTAAAQAIVSAAGGQVLTWPDLQPLTYQHGVNEFNPPFIVCAAEHPDWLAAAPVYQQSQHNARAEVVWHRALVSPGMRAAHLGQRPCCIWLTGLSGSGKSTIAGALELALQQEGRHTFLLDGDNIRHGLNRDLGMSNEDRAENIRRVGEVAKLMVDAGLLVVTAFISPFRGDRERVRSLFAPGQFIEVFVDTPLSICEQRDPKGLYRKAREGRIRDFTGIDSPYEAPEQPEIVLHPAEMDVQQCVSQIRAALAR